MSLSASRKRADGGFVAISSMINASSLVVGHLKAMFHVEQSPFTRDATGKPLGWVGPNTKHLNWSNQNPMQSNQL